MKSAYNKQKNAARTRGIEWLFDYESWLAVWVASGHLNERGRGRGKYVMARFGDVGPYRPDNVEIVLYEKNASDCRRNHPVGAAELSKRMIGSGRGWSFVKGAFQVCVAKKYIGRFKTEKEALAARDVAVAERTSRLGISGNHGESPGIAGNRGGA